MFTEKVQLQWSVQIILIQEMIFDRKSTLNWKKQ